MGTPIEFNDTLKISKERGFPPALTRERHMQDPTSATKLLVDDFFFWNNGERIYHRAPNRVFLVEEMPDGKWLYWGHAFVLEQTIKDGKTQGRYKITKIYDPDYQMKATIEESPKGKSYFDHESTSLDLENP